MNVNHGFIAIPTQKRFDNPGNHYIMVTLTRFRFILLPSLQLA